MKTKITIFYIYIMKQICKKCNIEKDLYDFNIDKKAKSGHINMCKLCFKEYSKNYRAANKEKIIISNDIWKNNNKDYFKSYERDKEKDKEYRINNKEKRKEYLEKNKEKIKEYNNSYRKNKRMNDPLFKLKCNYRSSVSKTFKYKGYKKNTISSKLLGCSYEDFKIYLESKFETWMTYDNQGLYDKDKYDYGWDIDHIIPLSNAATEDELIKLCHYTNLQPLCSKVNRDISLFNNCYSNRL